MKLPWEASQSRWGEPVAHPWSGKQWSCPGGWRRCRRCAHLHPGRLVIQICMPVVTRFVPAYFVTIAMCHYWSEYDIPKMSHLLLLYCQPSVKFPHSYAISQGLLDQQLPHFFQDPRQGLIFAGNLQECSVSLHSKPLQEMWWHARRLVPAVWGTNHLFFFQQFIEQWSWDV